LMREDKLLCLRRTGLCRQRRTRINDWCVVPSLTRGIVLTDLDQLWVADAICVHLAEEFGYLAVVLDAFSRKVFGRALGAVSQRQYRR
jgi:putative transposase